MRGRRERNNTMADTSDNSAPPLTQQVTEQVKQQGEQLKQQTQQVVQQGQQVAGQMLDKARDQIKTQVLQQKDTLTSGLTQASQALLLTSSHLREQNAETDLFSGYVDQAAEQVARAASYLKERDLEQVVGDVEGLARRNPAAFLTGALVLGMLASRFLKSSSSGNGAHAMVPYTPPAAPMRPAGSPTVTHMGTIDTGAPTGFGHIEDVAEELAHRSEVGAGDGR